jgi:hypothetical protein
MFLKKADTYLKVGQPRQMAVGLTLLRQLKSTTTLQFMLSGIEKPDVIYNNGTGTGDNTGNSTESVQEAVQEIVQ